MALGFQSPCLLSSCSSWRALNQSAAWSAPTELGFPVPGGTARYYQPPAPPTPRSPTFPTVMPRGQGSLGAHTPPRPIRRRLKLAPAIRLLFAVSGELVTKMLLSPTAPSHRRPTSCLSPLTSGVSGTGTAPRAGAGSSVPVGGACEITLGVLLLLFPAIGCLLLKIRKYIMVGEERSGEWGARGVLESGTHENRRRGSRRFAEWRDSMNSLSPSDCSCETCN